MPYLNLICSILFLFAAIIHVPSIYFNYKEGKPQKFSDWWGGVLYLISSVFWFISFITLLNIPKI